MPRSRSSPATAGGGYGEAIARALPQAIQVADRWHLMENASLGFLDAVRKSMRHVREVVGAATIDSGLLTSAERIQYDGYLRREEVDAAIIRALAEAGVPIHRICQRLGHSRRVVRAVNSRFSSIIPARSRSPNNGCERLLRPAVVQRKMTNGYRAMWVASGEADIRTVVGTGRISGVSPFAMLFATIGA